MEQVIYAKFSRERKKKYCIATKIIKNENEKCVRKNALTYEAIPHIQSICSNMEKLQDYYISEKVVITPCFMYDNNTVEFSYVDGIRYDKQFSNIIKTGDMKSIKEELVHLKSILHHVKAIEPFHTTDEFVDVFGNKAYDILIGKNAYTISNVDMIFANMLLKDDKIYITDYEWVFNFPVPVDYILYRSLLLNIDYSMMDENNKQQLLSSLNITDADKRCYEKMEEGFQQYVSGKNVFSEYKQNSTKRIIRLDNISTKSYPNAVQLIIKGLDGKIISKKCIQYKDVLEIKQDLMSETKSVKLQFEVEGAILKLQECYGCRNDDKVPLVVESNSSLVINDDYYFDVDCPFFEIENDGCESLHIKILVYYENSSIIGLYVKKILECESNHQQFSKSQNQLLHAENRISELEAEIERMKNTKAWKIYSKLKGL